MYTIYLFMEDYQLDFLFAIKYGVSVDEYNEGLQQCEHEYFEYIDKLLIKIKK